MTLSFPSSPPSDVLPAEEPNRGSLPLPLSVPDPHGWGVYGAVLLFAQRVRKSDSALLPTHLFQTITLFLLPGHQKMGSKLFRFGCTASW